MAHGLDGNPGAVVMQLLRVTRICSKYGTTSIEPSCLFEYETCHDVVTVVPARLLTGGRHC